MLDAQFQRLLLCYAHGKNTRCYQKCGSARLDGFSLVEVLVVVMVILVIAAIAIPNLVHGKMRANEAAAVASVQAIHTAEVLYNNTYPEIGYASSLKALGGSGPTCDKPTSTAACLITDEALTSGGQERLRI